LTAIERRPRQSRQARGVFATRSCRASSSVRNSTRFRASAHHVGNPFTLARPLRPPRPIASTIGRPTKHDKPLTHSLTLPLSPGTRGASRGREGRARSARASAPKRCTSQHHALSLSIRSAECQFSPPDSRSGAWGGGAGQVRGSRSGKINEVIAGIDRNRQPQQGLVWCKYRGVRN